MSDSEHSTVSYTSISSDSDPSAWGIPLMDAEEEMDPYEEEEESSEDDDKEEEEHLAPADSTAAASPVVDPVPSAEATEPFKTDESAVTPPPPPHRLLLTAPTPRFEVGESSAAAATRQSGSIMACGVDYRFVDTVDATVQASERRNMAAIDMVNLRVSYQAQVYRREREKSYTRKQDAQRPCPAQNVKMPPKRGTKIRTRTTPVTATATTTTPMTDAAIKALIAQGVADALAGDFLKCQPLNFKGTKGVVGLNQWFERMESVFHISIFKTMMPYTKLEYEGEGTDIASYTYAFQELSIDVGSMFLLESPDKSLNSNVGVFSA
ncbi:hypothetical protein Tco_0572496 [Tanacetum coccineum]